MCLGPLGTLLYGTESGLEAIDLATCTKAWTNLAYEVADAQRGWLSGEQVVVEDRDSGLWAVALADGELTEPFRLPGHGDWDPLELQAVHVIDGRTYVRYRQRLVCYDARGSVLGADIVTDERDYRWLLPVAGGMVLFSRQSTDQPRAPDQRERRTEHVYRIYHLSPSCKVISQMELPPVVNPFLDAAVVDGGLLLSTHAETLIIPVRSD
jgi:hypothetical protein